MVFGTVCTENVKKNVSKNKTIKRCTFFFLYVEIEKPVYKKIYIPMVVANKGRGALPPQPGTEVGDGGRRAVEIVGKVPRTCLYTQEMSS